jgi:hypothetical protein
VGTVHATSSWISQAEAAVSCWHSAEYQAAIPHGTPFSQGDFLIVEGYDGPQPRAVPKYCTGNCALTLFRSLPK